MCIQHTPIQVHSLAHLYTQLLSTSHCLHLICENWSWTKFIVNLTYIYLKIIILKRFLYWVLIGQPLYTFIEELQNRLSDPTASSCYYEVVQDLTCQGFKALQYMHKHCLYHLDIKREYSIVAVSSL